MNIILALITSAALVGAAVISPIMQILLGILLGIVVAIGILWLISPLYAPALTNKPVGGKRSGFHLFTFIEPGQVKLVERGGKLVRMIMATDGHKFHGSGAADTRWTIETCESDESNNPLTGIHPWLMPWARYVYKTTGAVFTGIYPFQQVREYKLERIKVRRKENAEKRTVGESNLQLEVTEDYSDHYRLREFLYPMHITGAETKDKIPLDIIGVGKMSVKNPYKSAYGTDRWDAAVVNLTTNAVGETTKMLTIDQSLTAETKEDAEKISKAVLTISADLQVTGIEIGGFDVLEINPDLDEDGLKTLASEALAKQKAKATREDGAARGDVIRSINKANQEAGELSIKTMEAEAMVRAAQAAGEGGGIVILSPSGNQATDPTQAAILAELRKLNQKKG